MQKGFPFATHGRTDWHRDHPWFDFDNTRFGEIGVEQLAARGRRNIAMVAPPMAQNYAQNMVAGATAVAGRLGVRFHALQGVSSDSPSTDIEAAMKAALGADPGIDGLISASTTACMAVVAAAEDLGRCIGEDIDLFAKEAIPFLKRFRRGILSVHEDVSTAGAFLARAAIQRIADPGRPPMQGLETPRF
jgi:LacI family transcriptional regulator